MLAIPAKVYILLHVLLLKPTKSSRKIFFFQKCIDFIALMCYNVLARKTAQGHIRKEYPMVQFMNSEHEKKYYSVLARMRSTDCYHRAIAYLFTLDSVCKNHIRLLGLRSTSGTPTLKRARRSGSLPTIYSPRLTLTTTLKQLS